MIPYTLPKLSSIDQVIEAEVVELSKSEKEFCTNPKPNPKGNEICLNGLLILQADKDTPAKVLNKVIKTANLAEFPNIMFAVNIKSARAK